MGLAPILHDGLHGVQNAVVQVEEDLVLLFQLGDIPYEHNLTKLQVRDDILQVFFQLPTCYVLGYILEHEGILGVDLLVLENVVAIEHLEPNLHGNRDRNQVYE